MWRVTDLSGLPSMPFMRRNARMGRGLRDILHVMEASTVKVLSFVLLHTKILQDPSSPLSVAGVISKFSSRDSSFCAPKKITVSTCEPFGVVSHIHVPNVLIDAALCQGFPCRT